MKGVCKETTMAAVNEAIEWRPAVKWDPVKLEIKEF